MSFNSSFYRESSASASTLLHVSSTGQRRQRRNCAKDQSWFLRRYFGTSSRRRAAEERSVLSVREYRGRREQRRDSPKEQAKTGCRVQPALLLRKLLMVTVLAFFLHVHYHYRKEYERDSGYLRCCEALAEDQETEGCGCYILY